MNQRDTLIYLFWNALIIFVFSKNLERYIKHIRLYLEKLRKTTLYVKLKKCEFYTQKVNFLSFEIRRHSVYLKKSKTDTFIGRDRELLKTFRSFFEFANLKIFFFLRTISLSKFYFSILSSS